MPQVGYTLMVVRNSPELTRKAIESVIWQDIPAKLFIIDNFSDLATKKVIWSYPEAWVYTNFSNLGVTKPWNFGLRNLFGSMGADSVLVVGNDTEIPPWYYRTLLGTGEQFITGVAIEPDSPPYWSDGVSREVNTVDKRPHPDFSAFVIRRECWMKIGEFDESMIYYAQDCDYHVRMHRAGIGAWKIACEFHHARSSTIKTVDPLERGEILRQADRDRGVFRSKYGCEIGSPDYDKLFA